MGFERLAVFARPLLLQGLFRRKGRFYMGSATPPVGDDVKKPPKAVRAFGG